MTCFDKGEVNWIIIDDLKLTNVPFPCCQFSSLGSNCKKVAPVTSASPCAQLYLAPPEQVVPTRTQRDSIRKRERGEGRNQMNINTPTSGNATFST